MDLPKIHVHVQQIRRWLMLVMSVVAVYWLQSATPIRYLDFWLPTASLALTLIVWAAISNILPAGSRPTAATHGFELKSTLLTATVIVALVGGIALLRYGPACCITPSRPPDIVSVGVGLGAIGLLAIGANLVFRCRPQLLTIVVLLIIALFVILKLDALGRGASAGLRILTGQAVDQASALDLRWLGFSYIAFRLIHVLRDRATGKLAADAIPLREFVSYVVFLPSLTAGPIDRVERFVKDYCNPAVPQLPDIVAGGQRILVGVLKKFVIADTLAIVALNSVNAAQANMVLWTWVLVYAFAFRIFFDFSGYTDIAIGLGRFLGIRLPENFDRPYLKPNLTLFWNSWHMTLSQWFRTYFFNPVTRALRTRKFAGGQTLSPAVIILTGQIGTMLLIGLWHGITLNFVVWGLWHAFGLFVHNRWSDFMRRRSAGAESPQTDSPLRRRLAAIAGGLLTFHFVALGWVWFALPSLDLSLVMFRKLLGVGP